MCPGEAGAVRAGVEGSAVKQIWHIYDSQVPILALASR